MIEEEIERTKLEIAESRDLLREAIERLSAGFANLGELLRASELEPGFAAAAAREVSAIVTALQFEDRLDQSLSRALGNLEAIEAGLRGGAAQAARRKARPAPQRHSEPGESELF
jgi:hypothetical protein